MTDPKTNKRHIEMPSEEQKHGSSYVEAATEMGSKAISGMAPASRGWILGAVVIILGSVAILEITNYLENTHRGTESGKYLIILEENRAQEVRRAQESSRLLAQALARDADRRGRQAADKEKAKDIVEARKDSYK